MKTIDEMTMKWNETDDRWRLSGAFDDQTVRPGRGGSPGCPGAGDGHAPSGPATPLPAFRWTVDGAPVDASASDRRVAFSFSIVSFFFNFFFFPRTRSSKTFHFWKTTSNQRHLGRSFLLEHLAFGLSF